METPQRERPALEPIWIDHRHPDGHPRTAFRVARNSFVLASPRTPLVLPSPVYPPSPGYDPTLRRHERGLVESLDPRRHWQRSSPPASASRILPPIVERALSSRPHGASLLDPDHPRSPMTSPALRRILPSPRRQTIIDETRSLLLSRVSPSHLRDATGPSDRRMSLPATPALYRRRNSYLMREHLQSWGHAYFGNASSADCFVVAVSLRRSSNSGSPGGDENMKAEPDATSPTKSTHRTIRARIRPKAPERKPFLLQRTFDVDELRATVPDPVPASMSSRRMSADLSSMPHALPERRRSSVAIISPRSPMSAKPIPIREYSPLTDEGRINFPWQNLACVRVLTPRVLLADLQYARIHLPVLAALMLSGHVREGDIIDLPMPHPEAWLQTVGHVYTGQGELTEAVKQNISYLGGKP